MLTKSCLLKRGWSEWAIKQFLPEPDAFIPNPVSFKLGKTPVYKLGHVKEVERSDQFIKWKARKGRLMSIYTAVMTERKRETIRSAESIEVRIPWVKNLIGRAINAYNWVNRRSKIKHASLNCDKEFLDRIMVNFIRHTYTDYDKIVRSVIGRVGAWEAQTIVNEKIYSEIARVYPELADECKIQLYIKLKTLKELGGNHDKKFSRDASKAGDVRRNTVREYMGHG